MTSTRPAQTLRIYVDSCIFVDWLDDTGFAPEVQQAMEMAVRGECALLTSVLAQAEVAFTATEKAGKQLDPAVTARMNKLWHPSSPVELVSLHPIVASRASDLIRSGVPFGRSGLGGADAVHLATAEREQAIELWTKNGRVQKMNRQLGFAVCEPHFLQPIRPVVVSGQTPSLFPGTPPSAPRIQT